MKATRLLLARPQGAPGPNRPVPALAVLQTVLQECPSLTWDELLSHLAEILASGDLQAWEKTERER